MTRKIVPTGNGYRAARIATRTLEEQASKVAPWTLLGGTGGFASGMIAARDLPPLPRIGVATAAAFVLAAVFSHFDD